MPWSGVYELPSHRTGPLTVRRHSLWLLSHSTGTLAIYRYFYRTSLAPIPGFFITTFGYLFVGGDRQPKRTKYITTVLVRSGLFSLHNPPIHLDVPLARVYQSITQVGV